MNLAFHVVHNSKSTNFVVGFPSGQREQTVNLPSSTSKVRILPPPPSRIHKLRFHKKTNLKEKQIGKDRDPSTRRFEPFHSPTHLILSPCQQTQWLKGGGQ